MNFAIVVSYGLGNCPSVIQSKLDMFPSPLIFPGYVYSIIRHTSEISERNEKQDGGIEEKEIVVCSLHPVTLID